jgi:Protein of unknown function (DUF2911)/Tetratricopeptide repeat
MPGFETNLYTSYFVLNTRYTTFAFLNKNIFMKKIFLIAAVAISSTVIAQPLKTPAPSSTQTIKQDFGLASIELSYSRPNVKGRKVMGDLVPFGKVWRTGANQATTLTFGDEVTIGDKKIPAGKYGLLSIPDKNSWTLIITKQTDVTSPDAYKQENDVVRVNALPISTANNVESFTMQFANVKASTCELHLMWEKTVVSLPISTDVESKVMKQIDDAMNKDNRPYYGAAMYYMDNAKDLNKALSWFDKAVEQTPGAFWVHHQRANCLAKLGKKEEAIAAANKSIELATTAKNADYVKLNQDLLKTLK